MLGICADDAPSGVAALKAWVAGLGLPRGLLHGMDSGGAALDMRSFGAVYIKYNSQPTERDGAGTAVLSGYGGDFRGVYFNVDLADGQFRQYAVLPPGLFDEGAAPPTAAPLASPPRGDAATPPLDVGAVRARLAPLIAPLAELGVEVSVEEVGADGAVVMRYAGPPKHQRAIELALRADRRVGRVTFAAAVRAVPSAAAVGSAASRRFKARARPAAHEPDPLALLHTQGWVVLPCATLLDDATLRAIRASSFAPIFNGHTKGEAPLRFQGRDWSWAPRVEALIGEALREAGMMVCNDGVSNKRVVDAYALRSLPCTSGPDDADSAARLGRQPFHSDAPEPENPGAAVCDLADADVPLSAMLAIQEGTVLWMCPDGCGESADAGARLVDVRVGEIIVWRGDVVHAGAGYAEEHFRVHAYVDPPARIYRRPKGRTNRCAG